MTEILNVYLADLIASHAKLQNLHWNVVGQFFKPVHEQTEEIYRSLYEYIDEIAEYMVMNGMRPLGSLNEFANKTTVKEIESQEYKAGEAVRFSLLVLEDLKEKAHQLHEETEDYMLEAKLEDQIDFYNKEIWFLRSMIQLNHRPKEEHFTIE